MLIEFKKPSPTTFQVHTMCVIRNVQQRITKVHQCQLSFILITNIKEGWGRRRDGGGGGVGEEEGWGRRRGGHM